MIFENIYENGTIYLSDGRGQLTYVFPGSHLEKIWRDLDTYLCLLNFEDASDSDRLAVFINLRNAISYYYWDREWSCGGTVTPASRRKHLLSLEASLRKTISGFRSMDGRTKEFINDLLIEELDEEKGMPDVLEKLECILGEVQKWADDKSEIKSGNTADKGLLAFIGDLIATYEGCSGRKAAKPYESTSKPSDNDETTYDGPFYRFCYEVLAVIDQSALPKLPHAIRVAIETRG